MGGGIRVSGHQAAEDGMGKLSFRMPLHAEYGEACMGNPFGNAVFCMLYDMQFPSGIVDGLMMGAVGNHVKPIEFGKNGIGLYGGGMYFIISIPGMGRGLRDMLPDVSSEKNIDDLHSFTDAQYRPFLFYEKFQSL